MGCVRFAGALFCFKGEGYEKTKLSTIILLVLPLLCSIFILFSCVSEVHTHNFSAKWIKVPLITGKLVQAVKKHEIRRNMIGITEPMQ